MKVTIDYEKNHRGILRRVATDENGNKYYISHTSLTRGYQSVKGNSYSRYDGKFGTGICEFSHCKQSTQYMYVSYFLDEKSAKKRGLIE